MCGIYGIVSRSMGKHEIQEKLTRMGNLLEHRGPDDRRELLLEHGDTVIGIGFVRLAIIDLETGMQPIVCDEDQTLIVCNGQIYNYLELKNSLVNVSFKSKGDIEVALHLYRKTGPGFLDLLNGMYAGVIYDPIKEIILLFRDRFGIKPLYYRADKTSFAFSSEIKPLFVPWSKRPGIREKGIIDYFSYRFVPGEKTIFSGIKRVLPANFLRFLLRSMKYEKKCYWEYEKHILPGQLTLKDAAERFSYLFDDAVRLRLRSDVEVGSFISGGIDSAAVAKKAAGLVPAMKLFTVTFREEKYDEYADVLRLVSKFRNDFKSARLVPVHCEIRGLERLYDIVEALEEPICLGTVIPTDMVCEKASNMLKVVLTGEGADEIFAGYRKFMIEVAAENFDDLSPALRRRLINFYPELKDYLKARSNNPAEQYIQLERLFDSSQIKMLTGISLDNSLPLEVMPRLMNSRLDPVNKMVVHEIRTRLTDYVVMRLDRLSMRHSLEARTPFLDYRLAEFSAALPPAMKANLHFNREKFICSFAHLYSGFLDAHCAFKRKQPFTFPMADWLSKYDSLPDFIKEIIYGDTIKRHNILDPEYVRLISASISPRGIGPQTLVSGADRLFAIIIFTLWYERFLC